MHTEIDIYIYIYEIFTYFGPIAALYLYFTYMSSLFFFR